MEYDPAEISLKINGEDLLPGWAELATSLRSFNED
jgi:hypothetical protein